MNRFTIFNLILQFIKSYISSPDKLEAHRAPNHFVRNRLLSMYQVILYLFYSSKASMNQNLASIRDELGALDFPNISKQALSKARKYISPDLFKELYFSSVDIFYKNIGTRKLWHGYHLFAIDGSRLEIPNSQSNFDRFGKMFSSHDPNRKFTLSLASVVYDVLDDYVVHASLNHSLYSERCAALEHLAQLEDLGIYENSIVIFDRGYYSEDMYRYCCEHNHLCLMRVKDNIGDKRVGDLKGQKNDLLLTLKGGKKPDTEDIPYRLISIPTDTNENEYLITNIFDKDISIDMFYELYFMRWPVESKYLELKTKLQIEEFNGATPNSIFQEFYINLLLANLASLVKNQVDEEIEITAKSTNKHRYQANRTFIIGRIKKTLPRFLSGCCDGSVIEQIYIDALKCRSQVQPGRSFKRNMKKIKNRTHFRNIKTAF